MPTIEEVDEEALPLPSSLDINPLKLFDIAKSEGRPLYAAAPMVRYSKLAFRETVAQYGVDLCWTPMILAKEFNRSIFARDSGKHVIILLSRVISSFKYTLIYSQTPYPIHKTKKLTFPPQISHSPPPPPQP
ncbi:hypothetical protein G7Y89_g6368 [Cudoniella acicularis]|uniref:DUS-like FMN-binding domain-containing protein n=1 Tax=Cudoniella acicularis TaxID=354080 RepID=A0A8H4RKM8_9HELO|nr:hypothetical protein G7Y89_g6368 [Cudoniella acicularis]